MTEVDLFGNPVAPQQKSAPESRVAVNDLGAVVAVLSRAISDRGYAVVGRNRRVHRMVGQITTRPATRWEADTVTQLLARGLVGLGTDRPLSCGAVTSQGAPVLVPSATRRRLASWEATLRRNPAISTRYPA
ncbi:hypothetical protein M8C13_18075 [Crossiella sp. SN42]|uniref:hypothetical protein n=1 Tax=Crossiella sp. SN42 TaxID=2944808 RepID=UPI00207D523A|nr:hypothetical protein [Crossiella sp. SN42]MCO1577667.1 hypothetical protein [Crossiella sp. SN42]